MDDSLIARLEFIANNQVIDEEREEVCDLAVEAIRDLERRLTAATSSTEDTSETLEMLKRWVDAYPLDIFPGLTQEERAAVSGGTITRLSAAMGRHMIEKGIRPAIESIHNLERRLAVALKELGAIRQEHADIAKFGVQVMLNDLRNQLVAVHQSLLAAEEDKAILRRRMETALAEQHSVRADLAAAQHALDEAEKVLAISVRADRLSAANDEIAALKQQLADMTDDYLRRHKDVNDQVAEMIALRHDIEQYIQRDTERLGEIAALRQWLEQDEKAMRDLVEALDLDGPQTDLPNLRKAIEALQQARRVTAEQLREPYAALAAEPLASQVQERE